MASGTAQGSAQPRGDPPFGSKPDGSLVELSEAAAAFRRSGFEAAKSGCFFQARQRLEAAAQLDPDDARTWAALGLCAFAEGKITQARRSWRVSVARDPDSAAARFIESVEKGDGREALEAYNEALEDAAAARWGPARSRLANVREVLPDFAPAAILLGLVHEAEGDSAAATHIWADAVDRFRDHPELLRLLGASAPETAHTARPARSYLPYAALAIAVIGLAGVVAISQTTGGTTRSGDTAQVEPALNQAAAPVDTPDNATQLPADADDPAEAAPAAERDPAVTAVQYDVAWGLYEEAREQSAAGDWAAAVPRLVLVDEMAAGRFYHDDALYLLARAHAIRGSSDEARQVAEALLARYPESIFANSVTRAIAGTGQHP